MVRDSTGGSGAGSVITADASSGIAAAGGARAGGGGSQEFRRLAARGVRTAIFRGAPHDEHERRLGRDVEVVTLGLAWVQFDGAPGKAPRRALRTIGDAFRVARIGFCFADGHHGCRPPLLAHPAIRERHALHQNVDGKIHGLHGYLLDLTLVNEAMDHTPARRSNPYGNSVAS